MHTARRPQHRATSVSLHTASLTLSHVSEQLVFDGRAEDISGQFAVKAKSVVKIEAEDPNYVSGEVVEILRTQYLEISVNLRTLMTRGKRESEPQPSGYRHSRTENTHKITNRKPAINRRHPAVFTGCLRPNHIPCHLT